MAVARHHYLSPHPWSNSARTHRTDPRGPPPERAVGRWVARMEPRQETVTANGIEFAYLTAPNTTRPELV